MPNREKKLIPVWEVRWNNYKNVQNRNIVMWIWEVQNGNARHCTTSSSRFIRRGPVKTVDSKSQIVSADQSSSDLQSVKREQDRSAYIHTTKKQAQPKWLLDPRCIPTLSGSSLTSVQLISFQFIRLRTDDSKLIDSQRCSAGLIVSFWVKVRKIFNPTFKSFFDFQIQLLRNSE